jgi:HK97 family phage portal protein
MNVLGLQLSHSLESGLSVAHGLGSEPALSIKALPPLAPLSNRGTYWPIIRESYAGAWQQNIDVSLVDVLQHPTVFACITLIATDVAKCRLRLVELDDDGIWTERDNPAFSPVLRKPNRYQTRILFIKCWLISKLAYGKTFVLKQRDNRRVVTAMYVLDPNRVTPLVAPDGSVYYQLRRDDLSQLPDETNTVPASEIIHDIMHPLYHPLVGVSPIHACGLSAIIGLRIENTSANFFTNAGTPSGMLSAPGAIKQETAERLAAYWNTNFTGEHAGKVAVAGDGLTFTPIQRSAVDSQLMQQWDATAKAICSTYHVPAYKVGVEAPPSYNNIEAQDRQYYSQCLQEHFESIESLLDEGMGLGPQFGNRYGTEFDLDDLLRLDSATMMSTITQGTGAGLIAINEGRKKINLPPATGGEEPILQQQNWPLSQIAERPAPAGMPLALPPASDDEDDEDDDEDVETRIAAVGDLLRKALELRVA